MKAKKNFDVESFIQKAKQREQDKMKYGSVYLKQYDMEFELKKIGFDIVMNHMSGIESSDLKGQLQAQKEIIYKSLPMLQNPEIQALNPGPYPSDVVTQIFNMDEITVLMDQLLKLNGVSDVDVADVKNELEQI